MSFVFSSIRDGMISRVCCLEQHNLISYHVAYFNVIPSTITLIAAAAHMRLVIVAKGYGGFDNKFGTIAVEYQSYCMFHQHAVDGMKSGFPSGKLNEQIIVRTNNSNNHTNSFKNVSDFSMNPEILWEISDLKPKMKESNL